MVNKRLYVRKINLIDCSDCPSFRYVDEDPKCKAVGWGKAYDIDLDKYDGDIFYPIPDWCPLPEIKEEIE